MDQKYGEFVGVDSLYAAIITEDSEANYIAKTPEYFAPAADVAGEPKTEITPTYYDNLPANNYVTEGETPLNITISGIPADKAAKYLGKYYDAASGRVLDTGAPNPPSVALSFRFNKGNDGFRYYQYLKGNFSGGAEEAASKAGKIEIKTYKMTFTALATTHQWNIDGKLQSLKRIFADTTDAAFNPTGWFNQVQTPDTTVAPAALTLSSSIPADAATGIVVSASPTMTFNNKVKSYNVTLINTVALTAIACVFSLDSTGKILTINPAADLTAATKYAIVATKVTDIYGQSLENTIIDFTTA